MGHPGILSQSKFTQDWRPGTFSVSLVQISFLRWFYPCISNNIAWKRKPSLCESLLFHATLLLMDRWIGNPPAT